MQVFITSSIHAHTPKMIRIKCQENMFSMKIVVGNRHSFSFFVSHFHDTSRALQSSAIKFHRGSVVSRAVHR